MFIWPIQSVEDRPDVTLTDWAAFEVPLNGPNEAWTRHLAGWSCEDRHGQVCSAIESFDPTTGQCLTSSGRVYRLTGRPGMNGDAQYVWNRWKRIAGVESERDVTREVLLAMKADQNPQTPAG
ncbi:hypothetical protein [Ramlibacter alkalitolerans]|uniref:Uncharacterized protein n=1 Tax=Ramlibacter alkalitolerans TaxID=2039631 RepID=A0ABS1JWT1_9BURK|nr:hypothetical protein [Ramlibacter alkalitolerans]MBL0428739.1 hypothetical protein [Ramlibacter alkalitolerans]